MSIETIKIDLNSVVAAVADQVSCDLEGEAAVLNLKTGVYYGLDDVGASVWRMLNEPRRVEELVDALLGEYEVDREECQRDVIALLGESPCAAWSRSTTASRAIPRYTTLSSGTSSF